MWTAAAVTQDLSSNSYAVNLPVATEQSNNLGMPRLFLVAVPLTAALACGGGGSKADTQPTPPATIDAGPSIPDAPKQGLRCQ